MLFLEIDLLDVLCAAQPTMDVIRARTKIKRVISSDLVESSIRIHINIEIIVDISMIDLIDDAVL